MKSKFPAFIEKIHPLLWQGICFALSILVFSLILVNRNPNFLRPLSMAMRTGFGLVIPSTALALYFLLRIPGRIGELIAVTGVLSLFALPLAGVWASGKSQSVLFNGLIPLADAANYYIDGLRILNGWEISHFSAMRPIFPGFLSLLLAVTDRNFMASLGILSAIAGFSVYFTGREVQRTHGTVAGAFLMIVLFLYYRHHAGTSMSETLGLAMGALGAGVIWRGLDRGSLSLSILGLFTITLALNIRPGTMFVLPLILLWIAVIFRSGRERVSLKVLISGTGAILLSFFINSQFVKTLADPSGTAFSNFSWALYGLASGGHSFNYVFETHPELLLVKDPEQSRTIYRMAFDLMMMQPRLTMEGALQRWSYFFSNTWYNAFAFVGGENFTVNNLARWSMYLLCALGLIKWIRKPADAIAGFVVIASLGVFLSVPFVPPTDAYRVRLYAATIVFFGLLPALGLVQLGEMFKLRAMILPASEVQPGRITPFFTGALILVILTAPMLSGIAYHSAPLADFTCPDELQQALVRFDPGAHLQIARDRDPFLDWMPNFHRGIFLLNSHDLADINIVYYLEDLKPPVAILYSLDYLSNTGMMVIIEPQKLPEPGTFMGLCGVYETNTDLRSFNIYLASEVIPVELE